MILNQATECLDDPAQRSDDFDTDGPCSGEINLWTSSSGETGAYRCERHGQAYAERSEAIYRDVSSRFPGFDVPGSMPPPWFDESYAGESWDED